MLGKLEEILRVSMQEDVMVRGLNGYNLRAES
jgi:hypothetical protein